ncbi:MAG: DUF6516 family protein [Patescibacteria group bacterium]
MYHLLDLLRKSRAVSRLDIITFIDEEDVQVLSVKTTLNDDSLLFVRELITADESKYSYHWQSKNGKLICRWDNAPHYPSIATHPHHKHEGMRENVVPSRELTLEVVLYIIEKQILE